MRKVVKIFIVILIYGLVGCSTEAPETEEILSSDTSSNDNSDISSSYNVDFSYKVEGLKISFYSSVENVDSDVTYKWDFGDNAGSSDEANPSYIYLEEKTYNVKLIVTSKGKEVEVTKEVTTGEMPISLDFTYINNGNKTVTVSAIVSGTDSSNIRYTWGTPDEFISAGNSKCSDLEKKCKDLTLTFATVDFHNIVLYATIDDKINIETHKKIYVTNYEPIELFNFTGNNPPTTTDMYVAIRIIGSSTKGSFKSDADHKKNGQPYVAYARDVEYMHQDSSVSRLFASQNADLLRSQGVDYRDDTGFSSADGNSFDMPIYYSDDKIKGRINGKNPIKIAFQNFAITDQSADTFFMGKPYFVRMNSSHPLIITVPMDTYNPDIHKNIAKVTVIINNDSDKPNYKVTLDGFVEKEK